MATVRRCNRAQLCVRACVCACLCVRVVCTHASDGKVLRVSLTLRHWLFIVFFCSRNLLM